jgi:hypothetical protein
MPDTSSRALVRRALFVVALTLVVVLGGTFLWLWAAFGGGIDELLNGSGPDADDRRVVEARDRATDELLVGRGALLASVTDPALGSSRPLATASGSDCEAGQHNWKIDDPYDLRCSAVDAVLVEGDEAAFREQALALHAALLDAGWTSGGDDAQWMIEQYWDQRATDDTGYGIGDLPTASYFRDGLSLRVQWLDITNGQVDTAPVYPVVLETEDGPVPGEDAAGLLTAGRFGVALAVSTQYFEE